jgi:hypothetical protein
LSERLVKHQAEREARCTNAASYSGQFVTRYLLTELGAAQTGKVAFRLIGARAIHAVRAPVVDAPHFVPGVQVVPGTRFVGMDRAAPGDAVSND